MGVRGRGWAGVRGGVRGTRRRVNLLALCRPPPARYHPPPPGAGVPPYLVAFRRDGGV